MNEHGSFYRKITYLVLIAVLLFPISYLGAPRTTEVDGGRLAQLRAEHDLGQSDLGDIDPASETIRLATLGMRGVAVSMLWSKANEYKKKEDWTNFRATLTQLSKLQPYFIKFWQYQAWNLTYNVSVELDDVRDRFHYVKRGIEFLKKGITYNRDSPYLLSELGWFIGNKIGKADEVKEYRRLFKNDPDFHPEDRPLDRRDNWLVSKEWYEKSVEAVENNYSLIGKKNPALFFSDPGRAQINYSEAIEKDGIFGEKARSAWSTAEKLWTAFGNLEIKSSLGPRIQLGRREEVEAEIKELQQQLNDLSPGALEKAITEQKDALTAEQLELLQRPANGLTDEESQERYSLLDQIVVDPQELATYIAKNTPELAAEARRLSNKVVANDLKLRMTRSNSDVVNFAYWDTRCKLEQTVAALKARDRAYEARRVFKNDADLLKARELYEESFAEWAKVFEEFDELDYDSPTGSDIMDEISVYSALLEQLDLNLADEEIGKDFPLWSVVAANDNSGQLYKIAEKFLEAQESTDEQPTGPSADEAPAAEEAPPKDEAADVEAGSDAEAEPAADEEPQDSQTSHFALPSPALAA